MLPPNDTVYKIVSLPRWQRNWVNSHRSINFSGLCQEIIDQLIATKDPSYFEEYNHLHNSRQTKRKENIQVVLAKIQTLT